MGEFEHRRNWTCANLDLGEFGSGRILTRGSLYFSNFGRR